MSAGPKNRLLIGRRRVILLALPHRASSRLADNLNLSPSPDQRAAMCARDH
jgi:hypothetical protein